jgi:TPR repeat protein
MAQLNIALMEYDGNGTQKNQSSAMAKLKTLAEDGLAEAQVFLARIYGSKMKYESSYKWLVIAANQKNSEAQELIGFMYEKGLYVEKDIKKAIDYYILAAKQGNKQAEEALDRLSN